MAVSKTQQEIGLEIFKDLYFDMQYEVSKYLLDEPRYYVIEKILKILPEHYRYKFLMNYNLTFVGSYSNMRDRSSMYFEWELFNKLPDPTTPKCEGDLDFWEHLCKQCETLRLKARKNNNIFKRPCCGEGVFLNEVFERNRRMKIIEEYKQDRENIDEYLEISDDSIREHLIWCDEDCEEDHRGEIEYYHRQIDVLKFKAANRAVSVAIKRFKKVHKEMYPNTTLEIDFDELCDILIKRLNRRDIFFELEIELIPVSENGCHILFLPESKYY